MWMNLHDLPADQAMYTIGVTNDPVDTPNDERYLEEIDVIAARGADSERVIMIARTAGKLADYPDARIVGVINQSDSYVMKQNWEGIE